MPSFKDGDLPFYYYGDDDAPAGAGKGIQNFKTIYDSLGPEEKFVDKHFPATSESLGNLPDLEGYTLGWFRPTEMARQLFDAPPIFHGPFDQFAVNQGRVGDCWFLSTLADVASQPKCIKMVVPEDNATIGFDKGIFHFRFWCRGKWIDVVVDDQIPCILKADGTIDSAALTRPTATGGFWASLFEKAYAKLYGKYERIDAGFPYDAMKDFTGGFFSRYSAAEGEQDWEKHIREWIRHDSLIALGTVSPCPPHLAAPHDPKNPGMEAISIEGIVCGHAYSVLGIQTIHYNDDPKMTVTVVKLRNPWGNHTEWRGPFSDFDPTWERVTPNLRKNPEQKRNDGEFWIPLVALKPYIEALDVCRYGSSFHGEMTGLNIINGVSFFQISEKFTAAHTGTVNSEWFRNPSRPGFYVHMWQYDPNANAIAPREDGYKYNCGLIVNMMYENYKRSGNDESVPAFGFYIIWAPEEQKPDDPGFFDSVKVVNKDGISQEGGGRDQNLNLNLPAGTAFIIPWIENEPKEPCNFLMRIAVEGVVYKYPHPPEGDGDYNVFLSV